MSPVRRIRRSREVHQVHCCRCGCLAGSVCGERPHGHVSRRAARVGGDSPRAHRGCALRPPGSLQTRPLLSARRRPGHRQAIRVGGRLGCITALKSHGVFAFDTSHIHVHVDRQATRLRSPKPHLEPLTTTNRLGAKLHWWPLGDPTAGDEYRVGLVDALAQASRCQHAWFAVASIDKPRPPVATGQKAPPNAGFRGHNWPLPTKARLPDAPVVRRRP